MKFSLILFLFLSTNFFAQRLYSDSITIIDGVYIRQHSCDYDTLLKIHENSLLVISDSNSTNYKFSEGKYRYLEIRIKTKNCNCKDCSWHQYFVINCTDILENTPILISGKNATWFRWSQWISPKIVSGFRGELKKEGESYTFFIGEYVNKDDPNWIYNLTRLTNFQVKK